MIGVTLAAAALCPLLPALQKLEASTTGILGAVLSGAGPSVLIFLNDKVGAALGDGSWTADV